MNFVAEQNILQVQKSDVAYRKALAQADKKWKHADTVLQLCGEKGIGKTALAVEYCRRKERSLYFSFKHLDVQLVPMLFSKSYPEIFGVCADWKSFFGRLREYAKQYHPVIFFDDVDDKKDKDDFFAALQGYMIAQDKCRALVVFISRKIIKLPLRYHMMALSAMSIAQLREDFPKLPVEDVLRLYAISVGLPELVSLYDPERNYADNMTALLRADSPYYRFAEQLLLETFRVPESYHMLLYAMATGHNRISEIADFCDSANNKCDKYIKAMAAEGWISQTQLPDETGRLRTHYDIRSSYLKLWHRHLFPIRHKLLFGIADDILQSLFKELDNTIVREAYRAACFRWFQENSFRVYPYYQVRHEDPHAYHRDITGCHFDFVQRDGEKMLFVKLWDGIHQRCDKEEFTKMEQAAASVNPHYHNSFVLFCTHRFSDYCWRESAKNADMKLVTIERLKY